MNWKTLVGAAALTLGLAASAYAAEAVGKVTSIDTGARTVTLEDGNVYDFSSPECTKQGTDVQCTLTSFNVGDNVTLVWQEMQGKRMGQAISPASQ